MGNIKPFKIKPGDAIGVIAPANPVKGVCADDVMQRGYAYLRGKGFDVIEGESLKESSRYHTSAPVETRVNEIHNFLKNDRVSCIMAFWGGFNSNQLLDYLDYDLIRSSRKIFIGYSDMTALTTAITTKTGLITFSGPAVISFAKPEPFDYTWSHFEEMCVAGRGAPIVSSEAFADDMYFLRQDNNHRVLKRNEGIKVFNGGAVSGEIVAGNLQTLLALVGTQYMPDVTGRIIFIEDDEESSPAMIDRCICQLQQMGWFERIAGLVIGRFTQYSGFSSEDSIESIIGRYTAGKKFPVLYNADFGHSDPMFTIPVGGTCSINAAQIRFDAAVE